jgi:hypothetical protein
MRSERITATDGLRNVVTVEPRQRFPDRPIRRLRVAQEPDDVSASLSALSPDRQDLAFELLRQGIGRARRWAALVRRPPPQFVAVVAETELLEPLCRCGALEIVDRWSPRDHAWRVSTFRTLAAGAAAVGHREPAELKAELVDQLTSEDLRARASDGPPPPMRWDAFAFVLRSAERWRELVDHDSTPSAKELATEFGHSKMWTPARERLFADLAGRPWEELFPPRPRQLRLKGPVTHPEGNLWADSVSSVPLVVLDTAIGIVCVENQDTHEQLLSHSAGWIVLQVPGGPPPAEVQLLARLHALAPALPILAAFDPDPAGIRIALTTAREAGIRFDSCLMTPEALQRASPLDLVDEDRKILDRLDGKAGDFEPLRAAIADQGRKAEQESLRAWLDEKLAALDPGAGSTTSRV